MQGRTKKTNLVTMLVGNDSIEGREKLLLSVEKTADGVKVQVGSVVHPMEEKHYIEWIEIVADGKAYHQFLNPGQAPEAIFNISAEQVTAREYCNVHGLWKG